VQLQNFRNGAPSIIIPHHLIKCTRIASHLRQRAACASRPTTSAPGNEPSEASQDSQAPTPSIHPNIGSTGNESRKAAKQQSSKITLCTFRWQSPFLPGLPGLNPTVLSPVSKVELLNHPFLASVMIHFRNRVGTRWSRITSRQGLSNPDLGFPHYWLAGLGPWWARYPYPTK
jgi:hypothetical protein